MIKAEELILTREWDKVFPKSEAVVHSKVTFVNHFGITLAADMYVPKNANGKLPAIAVSGPFGACKEQSLVSSPYLFHHILAAWLPQACSTLSQA